MADVCEQFGITHNKKRVILIFEFSKNAKELR